MSLIQVSSQSKNESDNNQKQTGYKFSNYFNGVLEIPPYSEIALHSAQFKINSINGIVLSSVGSSSSNDKPCLRMLMADTEDTYIEDVKKIDDEFPSNASANPFLYFLPRKEYGDLSTCWKDVGEYLKLDPRPQFQTNYSTAGEQISGLSVETNIVNSVFTPTFLLTSNLSGDENQIIDSSVFFTETKNLETITLDSADGSITKTTGSQGVVNPSFFYTKSNGIHNSNGTLNIQGFVNETEGTTNKNNQMLIGVKSWGEPTNTKSWADMRGCPSNLEQFTTDFFTKYPEPSFLPYAVMRCLFNSNGYNLPSESVCEYAFHITKKVSSINPSSGLESSKSPTLTFDMNEDVCNILKFERGRINEDETTNCNRWIMIATGDKIIQATFGIPYSKELDPRSDLDTWDQVDNKILNNGQPQEGGAIESTINLQGNVITFTFNAVDVSLYPNETNIGLIALQDQISDVVFPLQVAGMISKRASGFDNVTITTCGTQKPVLNYGYNYSDLDTYKNNKQIIPAEIFNYEFSEQSPKTYYPLNQDLTSVSTGSTEQTLTDASPYKIEIQPYLFFGSTDNGNAVSIQTKIKNQPNINSLIGSPDFLYLDTEDAYLTYTGDYTSTSLENPFLKGIYVRLKNLTNKSTFGSINSVDNDKLISVINRYDSTNQASGLTDFPLYSYNEFDRLYISLNNPSPLYLSQLDFELVDKFGTPIREIDNTTIILHLRPATYKDLYGYKRLEKLNF